MADQGQEIIALDRKRMEATCQKDIATLKSLLADDLVYIHSSARIDTKESLIGGIESGSSVYSKIDPSEVKARDLGDTVVLTGIAQIVVGNASRTQSFGVRFTDVYAKQGSNWQMVHWQSTRLPD